MTLQLGITLIPAFAILFIGLIVFFHNRKSFTNLFFLLMSLSTLFWSIAHYFSVTVSPEESLRWIRLVLFFGAPHAVFFAMFVYNFPNAKLEFSRKWLLLLLTILTTTMLATISPYVFTNIEITNGAINPTPGILMPLFGMTVIGSLIFAVVLMIRKYHQAKNTTRRQWRIMLIGTALSYTLLITTNFILVIFLNNTSYNLYGPIFMLPTFLGMTYAILRHNVLNIKAVTAEILTFMILVISMFEIFLANSQRELALKISIFIAFFIFGIFLIRSVIKEVKQREKIEELAKSLEKANTRLKELDRLKSEFVSIASHQLRSPLTAIKGYASLILEGSFGEVNKAVKEAIQKIFDSSNLMAVSVQDFLDVSRIEQGKMKYNFEKFDLEKLLSTVVEELTHIAKKKGLKLGLKITSEGNFFVNADIGKIKQVLYNLIDNSIKYTPEGSVDALMHHVHGQIRVEIHDTGVGIAPEVIPKLFSKFVRSRNAHHVNVSGAGLGLFVVKQMVEAHKGRVWATSKGERRGSTFHLELAPYHS